MCLFIYIYHFEDCVSWIVYQNGKKNNVNSLAAFIPKYEKKTLHYKICQYLVFKYRYWHHLNIGLFSAYRYSYHMVLFLTVYIPRYVLWLMAHPLKYPLEIIVNEVSIRSLINHKEFVIYPLSNCVEQHKIFHWQAANISKMHCNPLSNWERFALNYKYAVIDFFIILVTYHIFYTSVWSIVR